MFLFYECGCLVFVLICLFGCLFLYCLGCLLKCFLGYELKCVFGCVLKCVFGFWLRYIFGCWLRYVFFCGVGIPISLYTSVFRWGVLTDIFVLLIVLVNHVGDVLIWFSASKCILCFWPSFSWCFHRLSQLRLLGLHSWFLRLWFSCCLPCWILYEMLNMYRVLWVHSYFSCSIFTFVKLEFYFCFMVEF